MVNTVQHLPLAPGATLVRRSPARCTLSDLRATARPTRRRPTSTTAVYDVYGMAPSSSGGITVGESLNILGNFDLAG